MASSRDVRDSWHKTHTVVLPTALTITPVPIAIFPSTVALGASSTRLPVSRGTVRVRAVVVCHVYYADTHAPRARLSYRAPLSLIPVQKGCMCLCLLMARTTPSATSAQRCTCLTDRSSDAGRPSPSHCRPASRPASPPRHRPASRSLRSPRCSRSRGRATGPETRDERTDVRESGHSMRWESSQAHSGLGQATLFQHQKK